MTITWGMVIFGCTAVGLIIGLILRFQVKEVQPGETLKVFFSLAFYGAFAGIVICLLVTGIPLLWRLPLF